MGRIFRHDISAAGVDFPPAYAEDNQTACSIILVTPDTQRTMNTYLGACLTLTPDDMNEELIAGADWVYWKAILFDAPEGPRLLSGGRRISPVPTTPTCRLSPV